MSSGMLWQGAGDRAGFKSIERPEQDLEMKERDSEYETLMCMEKDYVEKKLQDKWAAEEEAFSRLGAEKAKMRGARPEEDQGGERGAPRAGAQAPCGR